MYLKSRDGSEISLLKMLKYAFASYYIEHIFNVYLEKLREYNITLVKIKNAKNINIF